MNRLYFQEDGPLDKCLVPNLSSPVPETDIILHSKETVSNPESNAAVTHTLHKMCLGVWENSQKYCLISPCDNRYKEVGDTRRGFVLSFEIVFI